MSRRPKASPVPDAALEAAETPAAPPPTPPAPAVPIDEVSMARRIATLPIDEVGPSPLQPRQHIVEGARDELLQSIKVHGIIEPLVVRERPADQLAAGKYTSPYELVAGEQRWTTAKRAGVEEVDVVIRELTDAQVIEFGLVENLRRTDLHPMDEAAAYERLMAMNPSYTDETLAERVGKDVSTIRKRRKLLRLIPNARAAFLHNAITVKHAEKLSTVPAEQQPAALERCFSDLLMFEEDDELNKSLLAAPEEIQERGTIAQLIWAQCWDKLAVALSSVGDLDAWLNDHVRADLKDKDVQAQLGLELPPTPEWMDPATVQEAEDEVLSTLLQLSDSTSWEFGKSQAKQAGVIHRDAWKELKEKEECPFMKRGAVVHGGQLRIVDRVCASKKCEKHWPKPKREASSGTAAAGKSNQREQWEAEQRREQEKRDAWDKAKPHAQRAFGKHVAGMKVTAQLIEAAFDPHTVRKIREDFGVALTAATIGQFLACTIVESWNREVFIKSAKAFGFDLAKAEAKLVPKEPATKPASKTVKKKATPPKKTSKAASKPKAAKGAAPKKKGARK